MTNLPKYIEKQPAVRQTNSLIRSTKTGINALTEYESKLYFYCIAMASLANGGGTIQDREYSIDIKEFAEASGIRIDNARTLLTENLKTIGKKSVEIKTEKGNGHFFRFSYIIEQEDKILYKLSLDILQYINPDYDSVHWTRIFLNNLLALKGVNNLRLYEYICSWKSNKQVVLTKEEYLRIMGKDSDTYALDTEFRRTLFYKPIDYLNKHTDLELSGRKTKDGKYMLSIKNKDSITIGKFVKEEEGSEDVRQET